MDQSLDQIIATRPRGIRRGTSRRGTGARSQILGNGTSTASNARARYASDVPAANGKIVKPAATKIIVSNLPQDVNEGQIRELFTATVGPLRAVTLNFDNQGRSKGVAAVTFARAGDGTKAYEQYNNRLIDGKRPMKIEIVVDPTKAPAASLTSRVTPAASIGAATGARGRGGRRGRGRGRRGNERPSKTAEDLDAEMEDYSATNNATAAAPTVTAV